MVYLPMNFGTLLNQQYAFVNFVAADDASRFKTQLQGCIGAGQFEAANPCVVSWCVDAKVPGGFAEKYRNSPVMHPLVPEKCKPMLFKAGKQIPFPPPTKHVPKPRG